MHLKKEIKTALLHKYVFHDGNRSAVSPVELEIHFSEDYELV